MSYEKQENFSDYEAPRKQLLILQGAEWFLLILSIAAGIYLLFTFKIILYAAVGVFTGAFISISICFCTSYLDLRMKRKDKTKK